MTNSALFLESDDHLDGDNIHVHCGRFAHNLMKTTPQVTRFNKKRAPVFSAKHWESAINIFTQLDWLVTRGYFT